MTAPDPTARASSGPGQRRMLLRVAGGVVVAVILVFAGWRGYVAVQDREHKKSEAIEQCLDAIHADIRERLEGAGTSASEAADQAEHAEFAKVDAHATSLSDDELTLLRDAGRTREDVSRDWAVDGEVEIPGELPSAARLGPFNRFDCTAVVFTDGTVLVTHQQIN